MLIVCISSAKLFCLQIFSENRDWFSCNLVLLWIYKSCVILVFEEYALRFSFSNTPWNGYEQSAARYCLYKPTKFFRRRAQAEFLVTAEHTSLFHDKYRRKRNQVAFRFRFAELANAVTRLVKKSSANIDLFFLPQSLYQPGLILKLRWGAYSYDKSREMGYNTSFRTDIFQVNFLR